MVFGTSSDSWNRDRRPWSLPMLHVSLDNDTFSGSALSSSEPNDYNIGQLSFTRPSANDRDSNHLLRYT